MIRMIAAIDRERGIANEHGIPWQGQIPTDTQRFHDVTAEGIIVMGYGTYREYDRPLHDRENFVVSRPDSDSLRPGFVAIANTDEFFDEHGDETVWVIGGAALFAASLARADELMLTQLDANFHCTKFFPAFADSFVLESEDGPLVEGGITFHFQQWHRSPAQ